MRRILRLGIVVAALMLTLEDVLPQTNGIALSNLGRPENGEFTMLDIYEERPDPWLPSGKMLVWGRSFVWQSFTTGQNASRLTSITIVFSSNSTAPLSKRSITIRDTNGGKIEFLTVHETQGSYGTRLRPVTPIILAANTTYWIAAEVIPENSNTFFSLKNTSSTSAIVAQTGWSFGSATTFSMYPGPRWSIDYPTAYQTSRPGSNDESSKLLFSVECDAVYPEIALEYPTGTDIMNNAPASPFQSFVPGSTSETRTYTLKNTGQAALENISIARSGNNPGDFVCSLLDANRLAPGASVTFTVAFTPTSAGFRSAMLLISSNDPDENPFVLNLAGEGLSPADIAVFDSLDSEIQNNSPAILFPDTLACLCADNIPSNNSSTSKTYTIKNTGQASLNITSISNTGTNASDFGIRGAIATNLAPNMTSQITINFEPETGGNKETTLRISSNDPDENPFLLTFRGFGIGTNLDSDGDGLNDAAEYCMSPLGFDWKVKQTNLVQNLYLNAPLAGLYLSNTIVANPSLLNLVSSTDYAASRALGRSDVTGNPTAYGLYTSNSIMDLRMGGLMMQRQGTNAVVSFQPQTATDLSQPFTNNGTPVTNTIPMPGNKGFIRINAKPEQSLP